MCVSMSSHKPPMKMSALNSPVKVSAPQANGGGMIGYSNQRDGHQNSPTTPSFYLPHTAPSSAECLRALTGHTQAIRHGEQLSYLVCKNGRNYCEHTDQRTWNQHGEDQDREGDILDADDPRRLTKPERVDNLVPVFGHECDIRRLDSHVRASHAHGNADGRCGQRRCIVDPVADHGHDSTRGLQLSDVFHFLFRHEARIELVNPQFARDSSSRAGIVSGEHERLDAHPVECRKPCLCLGPYTIAKG